MQAASAQAGAGLCERNEQFRHSVRYRLENARQAKRPGGRPCPVGQLAPVLDLPPEQRIRTVTGYLDEISGMHRAPRFARSPLTVRLGEQIKEFTSATVTANMGA